MKKSEIFDILEDEVCRVCQVSADRILDGCRLQSVVDARMLFVQYLRRIGLSNDDIALIVLRKLAKDDHLMLDLKEIKNKAKGVERLFNGYGMRKTESYAFCLMSKEIKAFCHEQYGQHYQDGMKRLPNQK